MQRQEDYNFHRRNQQYDEPVYSNKQMTNRDQHYIQEGPRRNKSYSHRRMYQEGPAQNHYHQETYYQEPLPHRNYNHVYSEPAYEQKSGKWVTGKHHYDSIGLDHLEKENAELKKELHRLRKVEASFLGGKKTKVIERVHKENHHYIDEKNKLEREFKTLHSERQEFIRQIQALEQENKELKDRNSYLEQENKNLALKNQELVNLNAKQIRDLESTLQNKHRTEITNVHTSYKNRHGDLENQITSLRAENQMLKDRHNTNVKTSEEEHTSAFATQQNKYENQIKNLQDEVDRLRANSQALQQQNTTLQEEVHKYQTNVYEIPTSNVDYDTIIKKYKAMNGQKDAEIAHLKSEIERYKNQIHQINLKYNELEARSKLTTDNGERQRLEFQINDLRQQLAYREQEVTKLNKIIKNAQNETIKTKQVINEYRSNTNVHPVKHYNLADNSTTRVIRTTDSNYHSNAPVRIIRRSIRSSQQNINNSQQNVQQQSSVIQEPQVLLN